MASCLSVVLPKNGARDWGLGAGAILNVEFQFRIPSSPPIEKPQVQKADLCYSCCQLVRRAMFSSVVEGSLTLKRTGTFSRLDT